jgi:hypothetical protein
LAVSSFALAVAMPAFASAQVIGPCEPTEPFPHGPGKLRVRSLDAWVTPGFTSSSWSTEYDCRVGGYTSGTYSDGFRARWRQHELTYAPGGLIVLWFEFPPDAVEATASLAGTGGDDPHPTRNLGSNRFDSKGHRWTFEAPDPTRRFNVGFTASWDGRGDSSRYLRLVPDREG